MTQLKFQTLIADETNLVSTLLATSSHRLMTAVRPWRYCLEEEEEGGGPVNRGDADTVPCTNVNLALVLPVG